MSRKEGKCGAATCCSCNKTAAACHKGMASNVWRVCADLLLEQSLTSLSDCSTTTQPFLNLTDTDTSGSRRSKSYTMFEGTPDPEETTPSVMTPADLPDLAEQMQSADATIQLESTRNLRKMLSIGTRCSCQHYYLVTDTAVPLVIPHTQRVAHLFRKQLMQTSFLAL